MAKIIYPRKAQEAKELQTIRRLNRRFDFLITDPDPVVVKERTKVKENKEEIVRATRRLFQQVNSL